MVKAKQARWLSNFKYHVSQHYADRREIKRLNSQIRRLMFKHKNMKFSIAQEGQKYIKKIELMDKLRNTLSKILKCKKKKLRPKQREKLLKMKMRLPVNTLVDRIQLMEMLSQICDKDALLGGRECWLRFWYGEDMQRQAKTEESLNQLANRTLHVVSDIYDLQAIIKYVKGARASTLHIEPAMPQANYPESTDNQRDVMAVIGTSSKSLKRRVQLGVRPRYILNNVPGMMPDMYNYLSF